MDNGNKVLRFETGISENYLPHWESVHGVREFVQNSVFAHTMLGDTLDLSYKDGYAIIHNTPSGIQKGKFLVGESDQRGMEGSPGYFGEGIKCGMLVLLRSGLEITLETNGFSVTPALEPSQLDPTVNSLVFYIEDTDKHNGTTVRIKCTEEIFEDAKDYFPVLRGIDQELMQKDSIIPELKGVISINGVKVSEQKALFGYNLTNPELMNRDRDSVNLDKVKDYVAQLLSDIQDVEVAKFVLTNIIKDNTCLEALSGIFGWASNKEVWSKALHNIYGNKLAIATGSEYDTQARYRNYKVIVGVPPEWDYFFTGTLGVPYTHNLKELAKEPKLVHSRPRGDAAQNLGWAKRLITMYIGDYGTVKISKNLQDSHGNRCDGMYDPESDIIWLDNSVLDSKEFTFKTLLHETLHKLTGANDNTEDFTRAWEDAAWMILTRGKGE